MIEIKLANLETQGDEVAEILKTTIKDPRFSKEYLIWKHVENPMGKSLVVIAEDNNRIIGVSLFLCWDIIDGNKKYKTIRNLDSGILEEYQGKGLFKKMASFGLELANKNSDFLFGTPNHNSLHPLLRIGWKQLDKKFLFYYTLNSLFPAKLPFIESREIPNDLPSETANFIKWRYLDNQYHWAIFNDGSIIIFRVKKIKKVKFIILVDSFELKKDIKKYVQSICFKNKSFVYIYLLNEKTKSLKNLFSYQKGSSVVISKDDKNNIVEKYNFSMGDLEATI